MAEEDDEENTGQEEEQGSKKCPPCPPPGLPGWMGTFSDLVTLLLTFFVLLLSFAKTETAKYEAALGSIRDAFGGNVLKHGKVIQRGKSPDDAPTMIDAQQPVKPFPIDFLTTEGMLDKHEINRASDEDLRQMRNDLYDHNLSNNADIYQMPEGIRVKIKDKIYFKQGSIEPDKITVPVYEKMVEMLKNKDWTIYVEGHAAPGETSSDGEMDSFELSSARAVAVSRSLVRRGVRPEKVITVSFGDSRPVDTSSNSEAKNRELSRRVEFSLRKRDLNSGGQKVQSR